MTPSFKKDYNNYPIKNVLCLKIFLRITIILATIAALTICWVIYRINSGQIIMLPPFFADMVAKWSVLQPEFSTLPTMAGLLATLTGLSLTFSINNVAKYTERYNDKEIAQTLLKEPYYLGIYYVVLPYIALLILMALLKIKEKYVFVCLYGLFLTCLYIILRYIKLLIKYATDFENVVLEEYRTIADNAYNPLSKRKEDLTDLINALEKIEKTLVHKVNQNESNSVITQLNWLENNFYRLIDLGKLNSSKFKYFLDPNGDFENAAPISLDFEEMDWVNFPSFTIIEQSHSPHIKLYTHQSLADKRTDNLISRYIQVIRKVSEAATIKKSDSVSRCCHIVLGNLLSIILIHLEEKSIDFNKVVQHYINDLTEVTVNSLISIKETKGSVPGFAYFSSYEVYLDHIFSPYTQSRYLHQLFEALYLFALDHNSEYMYHAECLRRTD